MTGAAIALSCVAIGSALYIRSGRLTKEKKVTLSTFSVGASRRHADEVARTYRELRQFLESLPRDRTLLLGEGWGSGQWKVIAGLDYYQPDSAVMTIARTRDLYTVVTCPAKAACADFDGIVRNHEGRILRYAPFKFEQVFATGNEHSAARVLRLRAAN